MSELESKPPVPIENPEPVEMAQPPRRSRLRRFFLRHLPISVASGVLLLAATLTGLYFAASSDRFQNYIRQYLVNRVETATGGRVEIAAFHWDILHLQAEADGLIIHGLEAPGEAPYAQISRLRFRFNMLGFWIPRFPLRDLEIIQPKLHLIVYPDGSTNQPQPRKPSKQGKPVIEQFFNFKVRHIAVEQGVLDYDNRASSFDYQARFIPLDFSANDLSLLMTHLPKAGGTPESYRIEIGVHDLNLTRGAAPKQGKPPLSTVEGFLHAELDLTRAKATLRSLRITARGHNIKDRTLEISGILEDFTNPRWHGKAVGELDLQLVEPITGYPAAPQGLARLDFTASGVAEKFRAEGTLHIDDGSYVDSVVIATGFQLDARVHADQDQLLVNSIILRLRQGGQIDGDLSLVHWLPAPPKADPHRSSGKIRVPKILPADVITIPVNGKVTSHFHDVALDTLLEMLCDPPFQSLGFDARVNGPANALWINGDSRTLAVDAVFAASPPALTAPGKVTASGSLDATYFERDGSVDLRKLDLRLPQSEFQAHGHLGAYPVTAPSALTVDLHSGNLNEFDTVLRDLELTHNGRSGTAALPIVLYGQGDYHGTWGGSLADPRLAGTVTASQLAIEIPSSLSAGSVPKPPQYIRLDSAEATGIYSGTRIDIAHALLRHGKAEVALSGSLVAGLPPTAAKATRRPAPPLSFDANSMLHIRLHAGQVGLDDLQALTGPNLPVTGALDAQLQADGPLRTLTGSGWVEMDKGTVFGEPIARIRAQGNIVNQTIRFTSLTATDVAGNLSATGSYDLDTHRFTLDAKSTGIDVARIESFRRQGLTVTGKLGFTVQGYGTFDDPRLEARASLPNLTLNGESLGGIELHALTANRAVTYDLTSRLEAAQLAVHGQTTLSGDYATQAKLDFSRFDVGALFKLAHLQSLNGESALAGTVTVEGPLARLSEMSGEARLNQFAFTVSGVHLQSEGGVHATLANSVIHLDPLHVTGEETDLHLQGSVSLKDKNQLDLTASGAINLKVAETLDRDLTASGNANFQVEAHGPMMNPDLRGQINFQNGSLSLEDLPNGLSQLHGTLEFNQNRLEVKSLTAMTGGGLLSVNGYLAYQHGLYADLTATGTGVRIRYPQGVSSLADAKFHLQGQQNNLLLSGDVLITRFTVSPDLDIAALAAQAASVETIAPLDAPSNHIRLDVHIASSPQLNFQNAYAKLAGNVDLHLRGTVASPSLLGRVSITEGSAVLAGTRYELQRGDIYFTNPVRIQPNIDLNATARVEDYDITLGLHGTPEKMAVTYRSDPPLPEADVVALLALGRTENQQRLYTQQQQQALANPTTDALLGGALNATVSSRVQKLFGAGSVKVDPNYLGALGNSTSRIIVEEQLGSNVTLTYATNVNTTAQQLIQADVAINHHVSLQLARDESGVFSVVVKATRRYR